MYNAHMTHHKQMLRGIAKFAAGIIVADAIFGAWLIISNSVPFAFLGVAYTAPMVLAWIDFDIILAAILIYYGCGDWTTLEPLY